MIKQLFVLDMGHKNSVKVMTVENSYWIEMIVE
jgi:hypothetical protein